MSVVALQSKYIMLIKIKQISSSFLVLNLVNCTIKRLRKSDTFLRKFFEKAWLMF